MNVQTDSSQTHPIHWLERFTRRLYSVFCKQVAQGWLLQEDADRLVKQAEESTVLLDSAVQS